MGIISVIEMGKPDVVDCAWDGSIISFLEAKYPEGFSGRSHALTCDGDLVDPEDYDSVTANDGRMVLALAPGGGDPLTIAIVAIVTIIVSVGLSLLFAPKAQSFGDREDPQSVYSVGTQANRARLGGVIPVPYGKSVRTPDYASQSYRRYDNNDEYRAFLLCVGQGRIDVDGVRIGETPVSELPAGLVRWKVFQPDDHRERLGAVEGMFGIHEDVATSGDVAGRELDPRKKFQARARARFDADSLFMDDSSVASKAKPGDQLVVRKAPRNGDYTVTAVEGQRVYTSPAIGGGGASAEFDLAIVGGASIVAGPFPVGPVGSKARVIEVDVEFPGGLYVPDDKGNLQPYSVEVQARLREINDAGEPIGAEIIRTLTERAETNTPQRRTWRIEGLPAARYQVSLQRLEFTNRTNQVDRMEWTGLKAYLDYDDAPAYGDVTLLALEILGAEALSSGSQQRIFAETMTQVRDADGNYFRSSNPADIATDIVVREYGAGQDASALDLPGLDAFRSSQAGRSGFNGIFDRRTTVFEALREVCYVGRAFPQQNGGQLSVVEDKPRAVRSSIVTPDVIARDSFSLSIHYRQSGGDDGIEVQYSDAQTFKSKTVKYPANSVRPRRVTVRGLTDDAEADSMALWIWRQEIYRNVDIEWGMELDARSFAGFDRVGIVYPSLGGAQYGSAIAFGPRWIALDTVIEDGSYWCVMRDPAGRASEPMQAVGETATGRLVFATDLPFTPVLSGEGIPTPVGFGTASQFLRDVTVTSITPTDSGTLIEGHLYRDDAWNDLI